MLLKYISTGVVSGVEGNTIHRRLCPRVVSLGYRVLLCTTEHVDRVAVLCMIHSSSSGTIQRRGLCVCVYMCSAVYKTTESVDNGEDRMLSRTAVTL